MMLSIQALSFLALATASLAAAKVRQELNFRVHFGDSPASFKIDVDRKFIERTKLKASLTRYAADIDEPDWTSGPPHKNVTAVRDYWVDDYRWSEVQDEINNKYKQFTTTVNTGPVTNYTEPVPLHFVHHRSSRKDAIPLLFSHGWPGSFLEVGHIIDGLTAPPKASDPAFHVIAPSIPGSGFSPAPIKPGFGTREIARAYNTLMPQLGYEKYVFQGGDYGGVILRQIAGLYPDNVVSVLSNFWFILPNATDIARYRANETRADENDAIERLQSYTNTLSGYRIVQQTRPLQLAVAMTDSPVGNAMWIWDLMHAATDYYKWTVREIITWTMMYHIQGPYGGFRLYKEALAEMSFIDNNSQDNLPFVHQPVAISQFPKDIWSAPLDWAQRSGNVVRRVVHDRGGHFAAHEAPDLLLADIRSFFGNETLSNTGVFRK